MYKSFEGCDPSLISPCDLMHKDTCISPSGLLRNSHLFITKIARLVAFLSPGKGKLFTLLLFIPVSYGNKARVVCSACLSSSLSRPLSKLHSVLLASSIASPIFSFQMPSGMALTQKVDCFHTPDSPTAYRLGPSLMKRRKIRA